jgi:hypothetical protein
MPERSTSLYLKELFSRSGYSAIGFKLMLSHCRSRPHIWSSLNEFGFRAVLVERRNVLKTLISRRAASATGVYHVSETLRRGSSVSQWTPRKIRLDADSLLRDLDLIASEHGTWREKIGKDTRCLDVTYEDYIADVVAGNEAILKFLGVRVLPLSSDLKKVNPDDLSRIVDNYDEVVATLRDTRYAEYLGTF